MTNGKLIGADKTFSGCSTDSRTIRQGELFIAIRGERHNGHDFINAAAGKGAVGAMVEAGSDHALPLIEVGNTREKLGALAGHWRDRFSLPVVAVTGSNGKTTVKEMINAVLSVSGEVLSTPGNQNNDIGVPLTLFNLNERHRFAVIEMGANHAGEISRLSQMAKPTVALIAQCAPAHLKGFGSVEGVARAKAEIYEGLAANGTAIINSDDDYAGLWLGMTRRHRQITFGLKGNADVTARHIDMNVSAGEITFTLVFAGDGININLRLFGIHNVVNALAASAACFALGISMAQIKTGLKKMQAVDGRMQLKAGINNARIFDDTYNANPHSLNAALRVVCELAGRSWLVLGDMGELGEASRHFHLQAGERARALGMERIYAIGPLSLETIRGFGVGGRHFEQVDELIDVLREDTVAGVNLLVKGSRAMAMERVVNALLKGER